MFYDILIIGGGAAGLMAAITAKRIKPNIKLAVLERLDRVGKKLLATGNGRCNITNKNILPERYHGENSCFSDYALANFTVEDAVDFFRSLGVLIYFDSSGKAYPYSLQASSVLDALRFEAEELGCEINCSEKVSSVTKTKSGFEIKAEGLYRAKNIIITTGGCASEKLGSDGSGFDLLKGLGHNVTEVNPAIVQVKTDPKLVRQLKGIKAECVVTAKLDGKAVGTDKGEVLFTDYGLSGPPILQLSRLVSQNKSGTVVFALDLMPEFEFSEVSELCMQRQRLHPSRPLGEFFTGMLNKRIGQVLIKSTGLSINDPTHILTPKHIKSIAGLIKSFEFITLNTTGFQNAQVTAGGIKTVDFSDNTFESKIAPGLFAAGEVLDIDGDCGGFNLQWAWSSGYFAALGAVKKIND